MKFQTSDTETHLRTSIKMITYRIAHLITIFLLSQALGATAAQGGAVVLVVITLGMTTYYLYDRVWLYIPWQRSQGYDSHTRSVTKSLLYRVIIMVLAFLTAIVFMGATVRTAIAFSILDQLIGLVLYYTWERVFNWISWGKIVKEKSLATE